MQKCYFAWIVSSFVVAIGVSPVVVSLPQVESRTGEPVMRTQPHSMSGARSQTANQSALSAEDRAAAMTLTKIENLQREISELRGIIETQDNELKTLKKSQQDLYMDLDNRINKMQTATKTASTTKKSTPQAVAQTAPLTTATDMLPTLPKDIKPSEPAAKPKPPKDEALMYQGAYNLVKNKRYEEAVQAFKEYLKEFPKGEHAANAHYWLGEVQMVQWQSDKNNSKLLENANKEFSNLNTEFPNHTKTADAVLKMGLIELEKNNIDAAKDHFQQVKTRYPGTTAARIAETRLQEIP
jgi:tol-pal system protein YbgF